MASQSPIYDLMLLLSTTAEEDQREKVLKSVESAISTAGGSIERDDDWGRRPMAYQIRHEPEAEYHLLQFTAPPALIEDLSHTLRITDGVLRFRVIKVRPGTPAAPSSPPPVVAVAAASATVEAPSASAVAAAPSAAEESLAESNAESDVDDGVDDGAEPEADGGADGGAGAEAQALEAEETPDSV